MNALSRGNANISLKTYLLPRVHVDPSHDGAEIVNGVADRGREELLGRIGLEDILRPS
jgi:hypothetical protein